MFGIDPDRDTPIEDLVEAIKTGVPLPQGRTDKMREKVQAVIVTYSDRLILDCDSLCINCPDGQVAACWVSFYERYPAEARLALEKVGISES